MDIYKATSADEEELGDEEALLYHLIRAEQHAQDALNLCYTEGSAKRSLWCRMLLGRAQSILMSLAVKELAVKRKD